jgi:hypothetical protein
VSRAAARLLRRHGAMPRRDDGNRPPWQAEFFGLHRVGEYRRAGNDLKQTVLAECAGAVLKESLSVERSGVVFCARMILIAETDAERQLYALIGAEEAKHSAWLEPWTHGMENAPDAFNRFIAALLDTGSAQPLAYLLQVVLEGFGILHYANLAAYCRTAPLAGVLKRMAHDEALHHAAGLAAFRAESLTAPERRFIAEGAYVFLEMIRSGPQAVAAALAHCLGLERAPAMFAELDADGATAAKLFRLRRLMARPGMEWLISELDDKGVFTPCTAAQCAAIARATSAARGL